MRALVLAVLASAASAKDPPPQCEGFGSCLMTGNIGPIADKKGRRKVGPAKG